MVTVRLMGGLGNQMFQYAIGCSMAHDLHEELYLDTAFYHRPHINTTPWPYQLYHFNIQCKIISNTPLSRLRYYYMRFLHLNLFSTYDTYICEESLSYDPGVIQKKGRIYLDGYWSCEKYFLHNADLIRNAFKILTPPDAQNENWSEMIKNTNAVCIHVRRGDYVNNAGANKIYGTISPDYYHRAIEYVSKMVHSPVFFVFSDDIQWAKDNILIPYEVHYMEHNDSVHGYEDLRLMMLCKHYIIANSTFSWWGAWLGNFSEKIVVSPRNWFSDPDKKIDIIPESWVKM